MGGLSIGHWLIVLLVIVLVFGTKKLRNVGSDLGSAVRDFRKGLSEGDNSTKPSLKADPDSDAAKTTGTENKNEHTNG